MKKREHDQEYKTPVPEQPVKKVPRWHKPRKRANKKMEESPAGASFREGPPEEPMLAWSVEDARFERRRRHG